MVEKYLFYDLRAYGGTYVLHSNLLQIDVMHTINYTHLMLNLYQPLIFSTYLRSIHTEIIILN